VGQKMPSASSRLVITILGGIETIPVMVLCAKSSSSANQAWKDDSP
jgi:hypothetical protein